MSTNIAEPRSADEAARRVVSTLVRAIAAPGIGALLAYALLVSALLPLVGLGSVERIAALGRHTDEQLAPRPVAAFLGNSIAREGIDARAVDQAAPAGWHAQNLALSGCGVTEMRVLLPKLLQARPAAVVVGFHPQDLGRATDLELDKAYAYAYGGFVAAWPADYERDSILGLSDESYAALRSSRWRQNLHFRTAPVNVFNDWVRLKMRRGGLRATAADNWLDPYEMTTSIRDERLTWHLDKVRHDMRALLDSADDTAAINVERLVREIDAGDVLPVLVSLPLHPDLQREFAAASEKLRNRLTQLAAQYRGIYVDAADALSADDYADALHPNATGRERYSRLLGERLPPPPDLPSRD